MRADVVLLPVDLQPHHLEGRAVVVFDVLRATTTMAAALAAGVAEIRVFSDLQSAKTARRAFHGSGILCGENNALRPPGFDLGNSPGVFNAREHAGLTLFFSTTNGTRAIVASTAAAKLFIGALVNISAVAQALHASGLDVTLLCSGTQGQYSMEDLLGCGAALDALGRLGTVSDDTDLVPVARRLFADARAELPVALRETRGGHNVIAADLTPDIDFAGDLDKFTVVGCVSGNSPVVRLLNSNSRGD